MHGGELITRQVKFQRFAAGDIAALFVYGTATLLWIVLLQRVPLSRAYPFAALGFVLVPLASAWLFGERISVPYVLGAAFVIVGIVTIGASD